ncbi:MAG: TetR family transcriptional regulator [Burkholderiales bacterium]|nr:TetR family transcriptional regulator [Burkholderiales bacterium]
MTRPTRLRQVEAAAPARRTAPRSASKPAASKPRDAAQTKLRILECATTEFADHGYAGARIESIVGAAGVNISLLYQYFESKEKLFIAVMEGAYGLVRESHHELDVRDQAPAQAMEALIRRTFRIFVEHPRIIGLLNSENVHRGRHILKSPYIRGLYTPLLEAIGGVLRRGGAAGVFRRDVDPLDFFVSMNGIGYFYLSNRYTLGVILNREMMTAEALARHEDHIVQVLLGYLRPATRP